ncbi:MAG: flippase-like domain-containing protein [Chloroflexi bacterium]|nr:flippase-like domain-containing protein [Chloroflexota bacterium]
MRRIIIGIILGAVLAWLAVRGINWGETRALLSGLSWQFVLLALTALIAGNFIKALRWRLLFVHEKISTARLFIVINAGTGINNILPIRVLNEVLSFALLTLRDKLDAGVVIATIVVDRTMDLLATVAFLLMGILLFPVAEPIRGSIYIAGAVFLVVSIGLFILFPTVARVPLLQRVHVIRSSYDALNALGHRKGRLAVVFLASLVFWLLTGLSGWFLATGLGLQVAFPAIMVAVVATTFLTSALPSLPGAVGTFEFGVVYFLGILSSSTGKEEALAFAIVTHLVFFLPSIFIALFVFIREGEALGKARMSFGSWMGRSHPQPQNKREP